MSPHPSIPPARDVLEWTSTAQGAVLLEDLTARPTPDTLARGLWIAAEYAGASTRELEEATGKSKSTVASALADVRRRMTSDADYRAEVHRLEERFADAHPAEDEDEELDPAETSRLSREALARMDELGL